MLFVPNQELATVGITHNSTEIIFFDIVLGLNINLTRSAGDESFPAWSPDGQQLIFYSQRNQRTDLYMMNIDDGSVKRLAASGGPGASPAWSPDGQWIAYTAIHQPNAGLYLVRPDGTDINRLTDFPVVTIMWSPDSQQIAFVGNCENNCDIYVVNINTTRIRQLTHNGLIDAYPVWSPDSRQLAFISNRSMSFELYIISIDCDESRLGGCTTQRLTQNRAADSFPAWSPDGKSIAFSSDRSGNYEVYTVSADCYRAIKGCGEQITQMTRRGGTDILPVWSPDGQQIAFLAADHSAHFDVYTVDVRDKTVRLLQHKLPDNGTVAWRPAQ
ncbi:MAG: PD40 domain-containing protein [Anaerolineae bacterium]|nr:PD40 domain-containing protein [Anaerolineae bacterium]